MKINPLHNFFFTYPFPHLDFVLQLFLMFQGTIFLFVINYNKVCLRQKSLSNNICIHTYKSTYFFNSQFQLGCHKIF